MVGRQCHLYGWVITAITIGILARQGEASHPPGEAETPDFEEEDALEILKSLCPAGALASLTSVCNDTAYPYISGCATISFHSVCNEPLEGRECTVVTFVNPLPFDGGPPKAYNGTCLRRQPCGPLPQVPAFAVGLNFLCCPPVLVVSLSPPFLILFCASLASHLWLAKAHNTAR